MSALVSRRAILGGAAGSIALAACGGRAEGESGVIRIGLMPNLSHAPVLAGLASGRIARAIAPLKIESRVFRAGPRVVEAMVGRALDFGVSGPAPLVVACAYHGPDAIRVVSGCASGGASLVVRSGIAIERGEDLHGKSIAVAQLGSTQDVSLRKYLRAHGLDSTTRGGDVTIHVMAASDSRAQMKLGRLDAAWVPEPWATRLVREIGATRFVDERDLWPGGRFATALIVARGDFVRTRRDDSQKLADAIVAEIDHARRDPERARDESYAEIQRLTTNAGKRAWFDEAWTKLEHTADPLESAVEAFATDAASLGVMPAVECKSLFARA